MSTQVDERVVSMQFDNKHFESNVATSMSTLDKLKAKLNLKGASKGLENIDSAAKKVNMSGLASGVETVRTRFSALEVMGVTALANITNSAVNAGKRIVSALTIDPVKTGFQEYETQINAVQTILSNTKSKGSTIDDVNRALEQLNLYADQTIYNFTEMTRNIGTFTAAGVDLDTSVNAIKGIANLAAVSGSTSQQASTAMYQLSQALASGTVKLMDWNSVVNAGMGGQVFQDALKETARVHGVNIDAMIETQGSFRETLSEGWLTSEILTDTLQKFTMTTEGLTEAQIESNRQMLKAKGYTEDQIKAIFELGTDATDAATKVKTFTQMWDVLKESAQSGWSQTWKTIIGDFEEAKAIFTPLTNFLTGFIGRMSDARNTFIAAVLYPWETLKKKLDTSPFGKIKDTIESTSKALEYYQEMMHSIWMGDWKNSDTGRYGLLDNAGHDHRVLQDLVNLSDEHFHEQGWKYKLTIEDVNTVLARYGHQTITAADSVEEMTTVLSELTDEQLTQLGLTEEEIKLYRALAEEAKRTGRPVMELIERMSEVDGRTLLLNGLKNAGDAVVGTFKAIGEAWGGIFDPPSIVRTYTIIEAFSKFTEKLRLTDKDTGELNENGKKLMRTFKGIFAVLDIVATILGGGLRIAFKIVSELLKIFGFNILDVTAFIGDALVKLRDWIDGLIDFRGIAEKIAPYVVKLGQWIKNAFSKISEYIKPAIAATKEWFIEFKNSKIIPFLSRLGQGIKNTFGKLAEYFSPAIQSVKDWFNSLKSSENLTYDIITGLAKGLVAGVKLIGGAIAMLASGGIEGLKSFFSKKEGDSVAGNIISGLVLGIRDGAKIIWDAMIELGKTLIEKFEGLFKIESPSKVFFAIGGFIVSGLLLGLKEGFPEVWDSITELGQGIIEAFNSIDWGAVIAVISTLGSIIVGYKIASALQGFSDAFEGFGDAMEDIGKGAKNFMNAKALTELAKGLAILVAAIVVMSFISPGDLWNGVAIITVLTILLAGLMALVIWAGKHQSELNSVKDIKDALQLGQLSLLLLSLSAAIGIIAIAMKSVGELDEDSFKQGLIAFGLISALMIAVMVLAKVMKHDMVAVLAITKGLMYVGAAIGIISIVTILLSKLDPTSLNNGLAAIMKLGAVIVGLMWIIKMIGGTTGAKDLGDAILSVSKAIGLLALVAVVLSWVDPAKLETGITAVGFLGLIVVGLMAVVKAIGGSEGADSLGKAMLSVSGSIAILALIAIVLSWVDRRKLDSGVAAVAALGVIVVGLMYLVKLIGGQEGAESLGKAILGVAGAIAILGLLAVLLGLVNPDTFKTGFEAVASLAVIVGALLVVCKNAKDVKAGPLFAIVAAIAVLATAVIILANLDPDKVLTASIAMSLMMGLFAVVIKTVSSLKTGKGWGKVMITIGILTGVIAALGLILLMLKDVNPANSMGNAVALSIMLGVLTGVCQLILNMTKTFKANKTATKSLITILAVFGALSLVLAAIALVLRLMQGIGFVQAIGHIAALSIMLLVLTGVVEILNKFPVNMGKVVKGAVGLLALAVPLLAFVGLLWLMNGVQNAIPNAVALGVLAGVMTLVLIPLTLIGTLSAAGALLGVLALLALAVPLVAFVGILALMQGIQNAETNAKVLGQLVVTLTAVLVVLAVVGPLALIGVAAMAALTLLIIGMGALVVAIGALFQKFPALESFIDTGIPILEKLAGGIGSIIGTFISSFATAALSGLPQIGLLLSQFMINATPFIVGMKIVDESVAEGVGYMVLAIVGLSAANFINGLTELMPFCGSLADLGTELSQFMINATPFMVGAMSINPKCLEGIKALAEAVMIITAANMLDGIWRFLSGAEESSMATFGNEIGDLGNGLSGFIRNLGNLGEEQVSVAERAARIIKILAEASRDIPNSGGWIGAIVGENDLGTFANQFPLLGEGIAAFTKALKGEDGTDLTPDAVDVATRASEIIKTIAEAASEIPNEGGWIAKVFGDNKIGEFSKNFGPMGSSIREFITNLTSSGENTVSFGDTEVDIARKAAEIIGVIANAAATIPETGGWVAKIFGDNDISKFKDNFGPLGSAVRAFADGVGTFTYPETVAIEHALNAIKTITTMASQFDSTADQWDFLDFGEGMLDLADYIYTFVHGNNTHKGLTSTDNRILLTNLAKINTVMVTLKNLNFTAKENASIRSFVQAMSDVSTGIKEAFIDSFTSEGTLGEIQNAAETFGNALVTGLKGQSDPVKEAAALVRNNAVNAVLINEAGNGSPLEEAGKTAGTDLGEGLVAGIKAMRDSVRAEAYSLGQLAVQGEKDGQASNSPSKLTILAGKWLGEGLIIGMKKIGKKVYNAGDVLGSTATDPISSAIAAISDVINSDIDAEPTIRPVFDLTDLKSGAATINGMLAGNRTLTVDTRSIGSVSAAMSKLQNGNNSKELLSAIKGLRKDVVNAPRNTYSINGINVTEGSDVAEAIATIVRAVKVEGRT